MKGLSLCAIFAVLFGCRSIGQSRVSGVGITENETAMRCVPEMPAYFAESLSLPVSPFICPSDPHRYPGDSYPTTDYFDESLAGRAMYLESYYWRAIGESNFDKMRDFVSLVKSPAYSDLLESSTYGPRFRHFLAFHFSFLALESDDQYAALKAIQPALIELKHVDQILKDSSKDKLSRKSYIQANNYQTFLEIITSDAIVNKDKLLKYLNDLASQGDNQANPEVFHEAVAYSSIVKTWTGDASILRLGASEIHDHLTGDFEATGMPILNTEIAPYRTRGLWMHYADAHAFLGMLEMQNYDSQNRMNQPCYKDAMVGLFEGLGAIETDYQKARLKEDPLACDKQVDSLPSKTLEKISIKTMSHLKRPGEQSCRDIDAQSRQAIGKADYSKVAKSFSRFYCGLRKAQTLGPKKDKTQHGENVANNIDITVNVNVNVSYQSKY